MPDDGRQRGRYRRKTEKEEKTMTKRLFATITLAVILSVTATCAFAQDYYVKQQYDGKAQWVQVDPNAKTVHIQASAADTREVAQKGFWQSVTALTRSNWGIGIAIVALILALIALLRRNGGNGGNNPTAPGQIQGQSQNIYLATGGGSWLPVWLGGPRGHQGPPGLPALPGATGPAGSAGKPGTPCQCKPKDSSTPPPAECIDWEARKIAVRAFELAKANRRRFNGVGQVIAKHHSAISHLLGATEEAEERLSDHDDHLSEHDRKIKVLGDFAVATCERPTAAEYRRRGIIDSLKECGFGQ